MIEENDKVSMDSNDSLNLKIYSKKAVWWFSIIFSPIFDGFLLRQNLIEEGRKKEATKVLIASALLTLLIMLILTSINQRSSGLTLTLNMLGGGVISEFFFEKYYPDENYEYKEIWKPLFICTIITIPFVIIVIYDALK
ncbi:MAG: hypothetical protein ACKOW2_05570 [Sphingobacteriaceae bacterium]